MKKDSAIKQTLANLITTDKNGSNLVLIEAFLADPKSDPAAEDNAALRLAIPTCRQVSRRLLRDPRILKELDKMKDTFGLRMSLQLAFTLGKADIVSLVCKILWPNLDPGTNTPPIFKDKPSAAKQLVKYEAEKKKILLHNSVKLCNLFVRAGVTKINEDVCWEISRFLSVERLPSLVPKQYP